jgi:PAS domain S-box-containing protein
LETLLGNLPGMAYRSDNDKNWTMHYLSQGCSDLTGYQPEDLIDNKKHTYDEIIHPDDRVYVHKEIQKALEKKQPFELTYRINTAEKVQKWVWEKGTGIFSPDGELISLEGFITDITERKQAEETLKKNALILDTSQRIGKIGGWFWDVLNQVMTWTPETFHIHDIEAVGTEIDFQSSVAASLACYPPQDRKKISALFNACIAEGTPYEYECAFTSTKGRPLWIRTAGHAVRENGRITSVIGYIMDITSQKQAALALEASQTRLRELVTHMHSGVAMYEAVEDGNDFIVKDLNQAAERIGSVKRVDAVGKSVRSVYPGVVEMGLFKAFQDTFRTGNPIELPTAFYEGNNLSIWVDNYVYKLPTGEVIAIFDDITERKRAEELLRVGESRFRVLFEQTAVGVAQLDTTTGRFMRINKKYCDLLGYTEGEMLKKTFHEITYPDDVEINVRNNNALLTGKVKNYSYEKRYLHKDGRIIWGNLTILPLWNPDEDPDNFAHIAVVEDITERKQVQDKLAESEERFRAFMDNFPATAYIKNEKLEHLYGNKAALEFAGKSFEEYIGIKTNAIYPDQLAQELEALDRAVIKEQRVVESEGYFPAPDGDMRWKRDIKFPLIGPNGEKLVGGIALDLTEKKRAEEKLTHSHDLMRYVIDHNRGDVAIHDRNLNYIYVSQRYLDDYNIKDRDVIGKHHYDVFPDLPQKWRDVHQKALAGEIISADNDPFVRADGTVDWTRWECRPWYEADGSIGGIIVYTEMITEQKLAQEAIRDSEERFRALFSAMNSGLSLFEVMCDDAGDPVNLRYLQVNPTYEQQNNLKAEDVIGKTILEVYPGFDPQWITYYGVVALTGEPFEKEVFNQPENKYFNYRAFSPKKGQVASISTDIHQQKLGQIALEKRKDELERFNRLSVGRELKMIELKKEINQLCRDLGKKPRYRTTFNQDAD